MSYFENCYRQTMLIQNLKNIENKTTKFLKYLCNTINLDLMVKIYNYKMINTYPDRLQKNTGV